MPNRGRTERVNADPGFSPIQWESVHGARKIFESGILRQTNVAAEQVTSEVVEPTLQIEEPQAPFFNLAKLLLSGQGEFPKQSELSPAVGKVMYLLKRAYPGETIEHFNVVVPNTNDKADVRMTISESTIKMVYIVVLESREETELYFGSRSDGEIEALSKAQIIIVDVERNPKSILKHIALRLHILESNEEGSVDVEAATE